MNKQYCTHWRRIDYVGGQHSNYPAYVFEDWVKEGWTLVTASIHASSPTEAHMFCLFERSAQQHSGGNDG